MLIVELMMNFNLVVIKYFESLVKIGKEEKEKKLMKFL